jgi:hypothetical protein
LLKTEWTDEMARAYVSLIQSNYGAAATATSRLPS